MVEKWPSPLTAHRNARVRNAQRNWCGQKKINNGAIATLVAERHFWQIQGVVCIGAALQGALGKLGHSQNSATRLIFEKYLQVSLRY